VGTQSSPSDINYTAEDFVDRVREITNGDGVHVVYESIGKATLKRSLRCLRVRGMCGAYGQASGVPDPVDIVEELGVPGSLFITRPAVFHYVTPRSALLAAVDDLFEVIRQGVVKSTIARTFPLSVAAEAHRFIEARKDDRIDCATSMSVARRYRPRPELQNGDERHSGQHFGDHPGGASRPEGLPAADELCCR
jgi:threonine dehydrogenase-like Zn-dependent dehydrogenase